MITPPLCFNSPYFTECLLRLYIKQLVIRHHSALLYGLWLMMWQTPFCVYSDATRPQSSPVTRLIHSNYPLENDSLFVVKHNVVGVFMRGFPVVLIMSAFVLILYWNCLWHMKGSLSMSWLFSAWYVFLKARECSVPLCCLSEQWVTGGESKVKIPNQPAHRHTQAASLLPQFEQISTLMEDEKEDKRDKDTMRNPQR